MNKIVKIDLNDILINNRDVSRMLDEACRHQNPMKITGCCPSNGSLLITLEQIGEHEDVHYIIAPFPKENIDELIAEINARYYSGFSTIAGFKIKDRTWGLFSYRHDIIPENE